MTGKVRLLAAEVPIGLNGYGFDYSNPDESTHELHLPCHAESLVRRWVGSYLTDFNTILRSIFLREIHAA